MVQGESEPKASIFDVVEQPVELDGRTYTRRMIVVDLSKIGGYETSGVPGEVVGKILGHTINGMIEHGASALGLDLDSMTGVIYARGHLEAALGVGCEILDDIASRTDGTTWKQWVNTEFPSALGLLYGADSEPAKLAAKIASGDTDVSMRY